MRPDVRVWYVPVGEVVVHSYGVDRDRKAWKRTQVGEGYEYEKLGTPTPSWDPVTIAPQEWLDYTPEGA